MLGWRQLIIAVIVIIVATQAVSSLSYVAVIRPVPIQENTEFSYELNFTSNSDCSTVIYSLEVNVTTDSTGVGTLNITTPTLSEIPSYMCEYRDATLRKVHSIGDTLSGNVSAKEGYFEENVGIGTSTPGEKLDVNGSINASEDICITGGNCLSESTGSVWTSDGENISYTDGKVGIGTSNLSPTYPERTLEVGGDGIAVVTTSLTSNLIRQGQDGLIYYHDTADYWQLESPGGDFRIADSWDTSKHLRLLADSSNNNYGLIELGENYTDGLIFYENNQNTLTLKQGNVGIGTETPAEKLEIKGSYGADVYGGLRLSDSGWSATGGPMVDFYNSNANNGNFSSARIFSVIGSSGIKPKIYFAVADSSRNLQNRMVIDDIGNVGIGTTTPHTKLEIQQSADSKGFRLNGYDDQNASYFDVSISNSGVPIITSSSAVVYYATEQYMYDNYNLGFGANYQQYYMKYDSNNDYFRIASNYVNGSYPNSTVWGDVFRIYDGTDDLIIPNGSLGIGTTNPGEKLEVAGNINASGDVCIEGGNCLSSITANSTQTSFGYRAGYQNNGNHQIAIGHNAGNSNSGETQTVVGIFAGQGNTGDYTVAMGPYASQSNEGDYQTAIGISAGAFNKGNYSTTIGDSAGYNNSGESQTATGHQAGYLNIGGSQTVTGIKSGHKNTGASQTAMGSDAGNENTGDDQTAIGVLSGRSNSGTQQTAIGAWSGRGNTGSRQTATGAYAGFLNTGDRVIGIGFYTTQNNTGDDVVAIGYQAGKDNNYDNQFIVQQTNINAVPLIQGNFSSGNVGIGTDSPEYALDVYPDLPGSYNIQDVARFGFSEHAWDIGSGARINIGSKNTAISSLTMGGENLGLIFETYGTPEFVRTERMRITGPGNVGIGTTTPGEKLEVNGSINVSSGEDICITGGNCLSTVSGGSSVWETSGSKIYYTNGNVGIGTNNSDAKLEIEGGNLLIDGSSTNGGQIYIDTNQFGIIGSSRRANYGDLILGYNLRGQSGDDNFYTHNTHANAGYAGIVVGYRGDITFYSKDGATTAGELISPTQVAKITENGTLFINKMRDLSGGNIVLQSDEGNVGIGTTNPLNKLSVTGASESTDIIGTGLKGIFAITTGNGSQFDEKLEMGVHDGDYSWMQALQAGNVFRDLVLQAGGGNVGIGTTTPSTKLEVNSTSSTIFTISRPSYSSAVFGLSNIGGVNPNSALFIDVPTYELLGNGVSRLVIDENGKVGFGTTTPGERLDVNGSINASGDICITGGNCLSDSAGSIWTTNGSNIAYDSGNVGIGISNPQGQLSFNNQVWSNGVKNYSTISQNVINSYYDDDGVHYTRYLDLVAYGNPIGSVGDSAIRFLTNSFTNASIPTEQMRITGNGNIGIGTTNPTHKLEVVNGNIRTNQAMISDSGVYSYYFGTLDGIAANTIIGTYNGFDTVFGENRNTAEYMRIKSGGNIGIGTNNPTVKLDIYSNTTASMKIRGDAVGGYRSPTFIELSAPSYDYGAGIFMTSDNGNQWYAGKLYGGGNDYTIGTSTTYADTTNASKFFINSGGNVGIGTTNPGEKLDVNGSINVSSGEDVCITGGNCLSTVSGANGSFDGTGSAGNISYFIDSDTLGSSPIYFNGTNIGIGKIPAGYRLDVSGYINSGGIVGNDNYLDNIKTQNLYTDSGQDFTFRQNSINGSELVTIQNNGNVGIGTTTPDKKLHVQATNGSSQIARFVNGDYNGVDAGTGLSITTGATSGDTYVRLQVSEQGGIDSNNLILQNSGGKVGIGTTDPNATLDIMGLTKVWHTDSPGSCSSTLEGSIYYDASLNEPCFCNATDWSQFDGGGTC